MSASVRVTTKRHSAIAQIAKNYESQLKGIVFRAANLVVTEAKQGLNQRGEGRFYKRGDVIHQASVAGAYPATDTGLLRRSIQSAIKNNGLQSYVYSDIEYAAHLEFGTSKMAARPFLQPSLEKARPFVKKLLAQVTASKKG